MNYYEYDESDYNYITNYSNEFTNRKFNFQIKLDKKIMTILIIIIIIGIGYLLLSKVNFKNSYESLEERLVDSAKNYVKNNNLKSDREYYLDTSKLNIKLEDNCSSLSGVFINNNHYQPYLTCNDYETNLIDNTNDYINLNGNTVYFVKSGKEYVEPFYEELKNVSVDINGIVNSEEGVYEVKYLITKNGSYIDTLERKVVVLNNDLIEEMYPSITLNGDNIEYLKVNEKFYDKGAISNDKLDGNINNIKVLGEVKTSQDGEYILNYVAVNSRGYASSVERRVVVLNNEIDVNIGEMIVPNKLTNGNVKIILNIYGNNYSHTKLPNNETSDQELIEYVVYENGSYEFVINDNNGNEIVKYVEVTNIRKEPPKGSCYANIYENYADITIDASSSVGISSYNYIYDNLESGYLNSYTFRAIKNNIKTVSVNVKDNVGNISNVSCSIKQMDPTINNSKIQYYRAFNDEYVIPRTKNNLDDFRSRVKGKISQSADKENCGSACLSFALYHAYFLQYGNMNKMNLYDACNYKYPIRYDVIYSTNKREILNYVYDEIFAGRVIVLQVSGNQGRHFVLVVGYRRSVYNKELLQEEDLIYIDSWGGNFNSIPNGSRRMYNDVSRGGYRVDKIKSEYYSLG